jgi:hypothetical protein
MRSGKVLPLESAEAAADGRHTLPACSPTALTAWPDSFLRFQPSECQGVFSGYPLNQL